MQHMRVQENNCLGGLDSQCHQDYHHIIEHQTEPELHMMDCVRKIRLDSASTNMASIDYSLKEQDSLHSQFSCLKVQEILQNKNLFMESQSQSLAHQMPSFVKTHSPQFDCPEEKLRSPAQQDVQQNSLQIEHKPQEEKDLHKKNKFHNDSNKITEQQRNEQQPVENKRKSYISSLHEIVDRNHLQSPSHKLMMNVQDTTEFENFRLEHNPSSSKKIEDKQTQKTENQNQELKTQQKKQNIIMPVLIQQKSDGNEKKQSSNSSKQSPKQRSQNNRVQIRRIPSNLYESYEELVLSVDKNEKPINKSPLDSPIKLKDKSNMRKESSNDSKQNDELKTHDNSRERKTRKNKRDQEMLVNLPVVEGFCIIFGENGKDIETKFVINKNEIFFQNQTKITINQISKIKLVNKEDRQLTIKLSYEQAGSKKTETKILGIQNSIESTYFRRTYQLYSEIILRKLLLMKLSINEVNEKIEAGSYVKSCQSSPTNSPILAPQSIKLIEVEKSEVNQYEAELFKRAVIFNSWEKKFFSLTVNSLQSFSSPPLNEQKSKLQSTLQKTTQIWTRFELIYGYLVIKLWQNKLEKTQIGIPLCDFTDTSGKSNWLYGLSNYILWGNN